MEGKPLSVYHHSVTGIRATSAASHNIKVRSQNVDLNQSKLGPRTI
jgi:hypothetical protein